MSNLLERADIRPGTMTMQVDHIKIVNLLCVEARELNLDQLLFESPFQLRRRGVELKLQLGDTPQEVDHTLECNVAKAQRWLATVVDGKSIMEVAKAENTPKRRVHDVVGLALLAPVLLDAIAQGQQNTGMTSDFLIESGVPADWSKQRQMFSKL